MSGLKMDGKDKILPQPVQRASNGETGIFLKRMAEVQMELSRPNG